MNKFAARSFALVAVAAALSACGGGDDNEPFPSALNAQVAVASGTEAALNGTYSSNTVSINDVEKFNPIGGDPETCRFRFSGLQQTGSSRLMDGDIRYIPGTNELRVTFISINGTEFRLQGTAQAAVDKVNNEIDYTGATLTSTQGTGATITLSGSIPMRGNRPEGC
ncbi:hypothetical protein FN976_13420 [Caenimonas sedimenti]|uniref:Lipoprotein n=1 Tax=Caenimonas sedimenti TaxID=2596921 RepID=A0A562ZPR0_9BURK|nr:hypothetical protein [Caenimonas sedimenti]TWO70560.1 hypothetical protein FN976_13420 [Caenimonas sedimenti]